MDTYAIKIENLSKSFRFAKQMGILNFIKKKKDPNVNQVFKAVDGLSFEIQKGEIVGIIGLNGSGKTTLLRLIAGIYKPDEGSIKVNGKLSPLMQLALGFQPDLDACENIVMNGLLLGISKPDIEKKIDEILSFAEVEKFAHMKLKHFSSGMRARLSFGISLQVDSEILLVDEILSVGDKEFRKKSYETFLSLKKQKKTILHATHNLERLEDFSDKILLLNKGKKIMIGEPSEVLKKYDEIKQPK